MKKILLIVAAIALIIPMTVGASFAADVTVAAATNDADLATNTGIPDCDVSFSKNVSAYYAGLAQEYAITTAHTSGNKTYGSHSATTLIYWLDNAAGSATTSASSTTIDGWTEM